jgi:hypothetical protein
MLILLKHEASEVKEGPHAMRAQSRRVAAVTLALIVATVAPRAVAAQGSEEPFAGVARQVPEFGGAYVDEGARRLYIWLTDTSDSILRQARSAVLDVLSGEFAAYQAIALQAKYSFLELTKWQDDITTRAGSLPGVVFVDADERNNRVTVAVEDVGRYGPAVETEIARLGIPSDAVRIVRSAPIRQLRKPSGVPAAIVAVVIAAALGMGFSFLWWRKRKGSMPLDAPANEGQPEHTSISS